MTESILAPIAALTLPDSTALTQRVQSALDFIAGFHIIDAETYGLAADELRSIKAKANVLEAQRTGITGPINTALKGINDLFRGPASLLNHAEQLLKGKMLAYDLEQERVAAEARRKAEEIAAAERKRIEEEAAMQRREAEAQAALAKKAQAEGDEQAAALARAASDRAHAESQAAATTAQLVTAQPIALVPTKVAGVSTSKKVNFEVTSLAQLVDHIAKHPELLNLVQADDVRLRAYVKGLGMACALPGVRVFEDRVLSSRAA